ncbi:MAG: histidine kinase dimerization/phospho-acceptor domain-containing protein, partial [Methylophilus sp.]
MLNALVIITAITQIYVGLTVYRKGRNNFTNIMFGVISLVTLAWALTNYAYTLNPASSSALYITRAVLFFVVLQNAAFYMFAKNYPLSTQAISAKKLMLYLGFSAVTAIATLSPFVFSSVTVADGQSNPNPGPLIAIFLIHAVYSISVSLAALFAKLHRSVGQSRKQLQFIVFASVLIWVVVPITNFAITLAFHTTFFARIGPIYTLMFSGIIAYAIISQRLFDIQAAVARSVAYTLTLVSLAATYVVVAFVLPTQLFNLQSTNIKTQLINASVALVLAFSFQSVKRVFDKVSNRFFYQDAYDPQELFNKLNRVLVNTTNLDQMLSKALEILEQSLKSEFSAVVLIAPGFDHPRIVGVSKKVLSDRAAHSFFDVLDTKGHKQVVAIDSLAAENNARELFIESNVSILARVGGLHRKGKNENGYLLLGPKRSGSTYSNQDIKVIETITNELAIAIQNALRFEEIERFNETLQQKIQDATLKLRESNLKLKKLNESKDDFIGMASHQLRTPLTSVKGYLSLVIDGDAGKVNATQRKLLEQAFTSSQRMVYLIADLLNVS